jgi:mannose-6-phosphate isomerase-like protein (cupin superfamily)
MQTGDCVLQPPLIRHRVLECSPGLEVIEVSCPAEHETFADHAMELPTATVETTREFGGQRFVHHRAAAAVWQSAGIAWEARDLDIATATAGLAGARVLHACGGLHDELRHLHDGEFRLYAVLRGTAVLSTDDCGQHNLCTGDACTLPAHTGYTIATPGGDCELLEVSLPPLDRVSHRAQRGLDPRPGPAT